MNKMTLPLKVTVLAALLTLPLQISADAIPGLYNTGVDDSGTVLADGSTDPHYSILETGGNAILLAPAHGAYVPNSTDSKWVWQQANGQPGSVIRTFRLTFDMTGLDPATAVIGGRSTSDNDTRDILVNGNSTGETTPFGGFGSWHDFSIPSAFLVGGINTIDFRVNDGGAPAGFRAEISGTADPISTGVPDAGGTALLVAFSAAALAAAKRRVG